MAPMSMAAFVLGAVLLLIAFVGGSFKIFAAEISGSAGRLTRWTSGGLGLVLILIGLAFAILELQPQPSPEPDRPAPVNAVVTPQPVPTTAAPAPARAEVVVDERSSGFRTDGDDDFWFESAVGFGSHMYWTYASSDEAYSSGEWRATLAGGNYEVLVFVPRDKAGTENARYEVFHSSGTTVRSVDQSIHSDVWVSIGSFHFRAGDEPRVRLRDLTGEDLEDEIPVGFDAVKFVPR